MCWVQVRTQKAGARRWPHAGARQQRGEAALRVLRAVVGQSNRSSAVGHSTSNSAGGRGRDALQECPEQHQSSQRAEVWVYKVFADAI